MTSEFIHEEISIMEYNGLSWTIMGGLSWTIIDCQESYTIQEGKTIMDYHVSFSVAVAT